MGAGGSDLGSVLVLFFFLFSCPGSASNLLCALGQVLSPF